MKLEDFIPQLNPNKNYWLVRTQSGEFYDEFYFDNFIGIGWNEIDDINLIKDENKHNSLVELVKKHYEDEQRPSHVANQIRKFVKDIKKGDIVIIPSRSSTHISFGEVLEDNVYIKEIDLEKIEHECPFFKRKKVCWIKTQNREGLDPYLYKLLYSQHTITNANEYAPFIDRSVSTFFQKGDKAHLILSVQTKNEIHARDLLQLIDSSLSIVETFNGITNSNLDPSQVEIKINVQSPGPIELLGNAGTIAVIGIGLVFLVGGGFKLEKKSDGTFITEATSDGFMEKLIKFIDHLHKNRMDRLDAESAKKLEVKIPEELTSGITSKCENNDQSL